MIESLYPLLRSALFRMDPEHAHDLSMATLRLTEKSGLMALFAKADDAKASPVRVMGLDFPNRVGLAAGLDKRGDTLDALGALGFGHIEVGTITPRPQLGNPKPRLFRLLSHEAIINRMGFNNPGVEQGVDFVRSSSSYRGVIGFNIGKNKDTPNSEAAEDYLRCMRAAYPVADYIAVNLSSPNTPGLRDLQGAESSARLLDALKAEQARLEREYHKFVPLVFKVAPDLENSQIAGLSQVFLDGGLDGLIATNTTIERADVMSHAFAKQAGGLSGKPLLHRSNRVLGEFSSYLGGKIPIIGVGGISSAEDAMEKLRLGASLVQIYTAFIYQGPRLVRELAAIDPP
ncbi:MAG: quinone-dependent dihydroorotate dehydrogenase [Luteolibacter sp.]